MGDDLPAPGALLAPFGTSPRRCPIGQWTRATTPTASATGPRARDAIPVIPMRRNRKARAGVDKTLYALRNLVERCFGRLKNSRRVATRYDKTAASFLGFVDIACIRLRIRRSVNTA